MLSDDPMSDLIVDDNKVMALWRMAGLPEYFLGNGGTNEKLLRFAESFAADRNAELTAEVERLRAENAQLSAINNGLQDFLDRAFVAHPNLDLDIEAIKEAGNG